MSSCLLVLAEQKPKAEEMHGSWAPPVNPHLSELPPRDCYRSLSLPGEQVGSDDTATPSLGAPKVPFVC